ncbi:hypothetical protein H6F77_21715 [Microcoleus sp. FACHB-831]|uniref:hypothetical protein n=1 Tax=Microcoleus sp. FACHB-831 TaxID=2692827 RepID=UPI0016820872|nr:hypothetical protein [Microcoleus sp. FACHB-831]MBD1923669.1 hypothetical protein [Microcoleus sp. FACHB-831]
MIKPYNCILGIALLGLTTVQVSAEPINKVNQRVQFSRGSTSTTIRGSVPLGKKDTYIFRARKGQTIIADVTWRGTRVGNSDDSGLSGFTFVEPSGKAIPDPQDITFSAISTGDYKVIVAQPYKLTSPAYTFKLTIR